LLENIVVIPVMRKFHDRKKSLIIISRFVGKTLEIKLTLSLETLISAFFFEFSINQFFFETDLNQFLIDFDIREMDHKLLIS